MDTLPQEVIDNICDCLARDIGSSKELRLTARRFSRTMQHIFHTLIIYQHPEKWQNINNIADVPALARLVHTIKLVREQPLPENRLSALPPAWEEARHMSGYVDVKQAHLAHEYWNSGYEEIKEWYRRLRRLRLIKGRKEWPLPELHLERLTWLQRVETIGHTELCFLNSSLSRYRGNVQGWSRQEEETAMQIEWRGGHLDHNPNLEVFLSALQRSGKKFLTLALHSVGELIPDRAPGYLGLELAFLRVLDIDLTKLPMFILPCRRIPFTTYLRQLGGLERLSLKQNPYSAYYCGSSNSVKGLNVLAILEQGTYPKLQSLKLRHILTPEDTLRRFLKKFRDTLVSLSIEEPLIKLSLWNGLRKAILDGPNNDIFLPREGTELHLTGSFFELHPDHSLPNEIFPIPPAGSNYWTMDA